MAPNTSATTSVEEAEEHYDDDLYRDISSTHSSFKRIKANVFFLVGSILQLSPALAGVITNGESKTKIWSIVLASIGSSFYLANGIFETVIAHQAYRKQQDSQQEQYSTSRPYLYDVINGCLFAFAAWEELLNSIFHFLTLSFVSNISYLVTAILTLWLRRIETQSATQKLTKEDRMVRFGDVLFFVGCILDVWANVRQAKLNNENHTANSSHLIRLEELSLASAALWFTDAILYLLADKMNFDNSRRQSLRQYKSIEMQSISRSASMKADSEEEDQTETAKPEARLLSRFV